MTAADTDLGPGQPADTLDLGKVALVVLGFAILCFLTALVLSFESTVIDTEVLGDQPLGPLKVEQAGTVYRVEVRGGLPDQSWRYVEVVLLDLQGDYLLSFGSELYRESGRDSEGFWQEQELNFDTKVTVPEAGEYFLGFQINGGDTNQTESTDAIVDTPLQVRVHEVMGSSIPHMVFGILLIIVGLVLNEMKNLTISRLIRSFEFSDD